MKGPGRIPHPIADERLHMGYFAGREKAADGAQIFARLRRLVIREPELDDLAPRIDRQMKTPEVEDPPDLPYAGRFRVLAKVSPEPFLANVIGAGCGLQAGPVLEHLEPGLFGPARIRGDPSWTRPFASACVATGRRP